MDYSDLYILKKIKKLEEDISLLSSLMGRVTTVISGATQVYEVYADPITSGFLPDVLSKPAIALIYDPDTNDPVDSAWWQVSQQRWI